MRARVEKADEVTDAVRADKIDEIKSNCLFEFVYSKSFWTRYLLISLWNQVIMEQKLPSKAEVCHWIPKRWKRFANWHSSALGQCLWNRSGGRELSEEMGSPISMRRHRSSDVCDKPRSGRPCTANNDENTERLDQLIRENRRMTITEMRSVLDVGAEQ